MSDVRFAVIGIGASDFFPEFPTGSATYLYKSLQMEMAIRPSIAKLEI
jgi:hypothetical protein